MRARREADQDHGFTVAGLCSSTSRWHKKPGEAQPCKPSKNHEHRETMKTMILKVLELVKGRDVRPAF